MKRTGVTYSLHHIGIPTTVRLPDERHMAAAGMFTTDYLEGPVPVQWHRFEADSPLHPLIQNEPTVAYKVSDLATAIEGHSVILGPYEPLAGFRVAVIDHDGVPIEFVETELSDEELWAMANR